MKYIVALIEDKEEIFIFPKCIDHDRYYEGLAAIRVGSHQNWERFVYGDPANLVSAGFITGGKCHGRSETLNRDSRPELDTKLFRSKLQ